MDMNGMGFWMHLFMTSVMWSFIFGVFVAAEEESPGPKWLRDFFISGFILGILVALICITRGIWTL